MLHAQTHQARTGADHCRTIHRCFGAQGLGLESDMVPPAIAELAGAEVGSGSPAKNPNAALYVPESEQAELLACWADSVFLKFRWASKDVGTP